MNLEKNEKYSVLTPKKDSNFSDFYSNFTKNSINFEKDHLIIDLSKLDVKPEELVLFKEISEKKVASGTSFVIICKTVSYDDITEEIVVVPTFQEAIDMIEMDEMSVLLLDSANTVNGWSSFVPGVMPVRLTVCGPASSLMGAGSGIGSRVGGSLTGATVTTKVLVV